MGTNTYVFFLIIRPCQMQGSPISKWGAGPEAYQAYNPGGPDSVKGTNAAGGIVW